jgi:uncharacterized integral membrane protein
MSPNEGTPDTGGFKRTGPQRKVDPGIVAAAIVAVALLLFIVQNSQEARVKWLFWDGHAPLWVVIVITALLAAISTQLALYIWRRRRNE